MSNLTDAAGNLFNDNSRTLAVNAVAAQVALMTSVSILTVIAFNVLRPGNKIIYEPKVKYHVGNKPPPRISNSFFGWLPPLINTEEQELLDKLGLDAVAFLRFNNLMRWLFTCIAGLTGAILIPVNVFYNLRHVPNHDALSMLTIRDVSGNFLYFHVFASYAITLIIICFVNSNWKAMLRLRHAWFHSPEYLESFYARTLTVFNVPKRNQSDEGLKAIFNTVQVPYPTTSVHIGRKVGELPLLIQYHNTTVREFEAILVKYLKGGKLGKKRPTIRIGGTWGFGGRNLDAIDYYTAKLKRTEAKVLEYRNNLDNRKPESYGFASMAAVPYAHVVAKILRSKHPKGTTIELAPNPKDIIWENIGQTNFELVRKRVIGFAWLTFVSFFNTVPLFIISVLANLDTLRAYVHFLDDWATSSPNFFAFVSGVLPPAVSGFFGFFLPIIMRWLTQYMGALTNSSLDRAVVARYFSFLVISQLFIFTLLGVLFNLARLIQDQIGKKASLNQILDKLNSLPADVNHTYINQAPYWLTFFPLRGFLVVFDLAQIINLVWISLKTRLLGRTPRDIREWTQPPEFQYAIYYSNILFMGAVGLVFAPLAPLVVFAAAVVFWMGSWVHKYQLMFVYVTKVESGGRLWNVVINRLLFCVVLMQLLMILTIGLQYQFRTFQWLSTVPPLLFVLLFKIYISKVYLPAFEYHIPSEAEIKLAHVHSERADARSHRLERRFGHPALHAELFTPMLHARLMPLLAQVYQGNLGNDEAQLNEYGGQKMAAQIIPGGIRIAAVSQNQLEYDPVLYQRDRGELDWDARSVASTQMLDAPSMLGRQKIHESTCSLGRFTAYGQYLSQGPQRFADVDTQQQPLLHFHSRGFGSQHSLAAPLPPSAYQTPSDNDREAPVYWPREGIYPPNPHYSQSFIPRTQSPVPQGVEPLLYPATR